MVDLFKYYIYSNMWTNNKRVANFIGLFVVCLAHLRVTNCIYIPLDRDSTRCMVVYTVSESQTVKLDVNFPALPDQQPGEFYELNWTNTQTQQVQSESMINGRLKKEISLTQNVLYDVCMKVYSVRSFGTTYVEYSQLHHFAYDHEIIKVPDNLLKESHLTDAFLSAVDILKNVDSYEKMQNNRTNIHAEVFRKTNKISSRLVQISFAQLALIILASAYQFWAISKYLKSRSQA